MAVTIKGATTIRGNTTVGFSPASLFAAGEQGVWLDPSDFSTMFQDAAGTTPVTAVEQPVGRILDKSGRGNHATQFTSGNRPVLSARVNLLTKTEQFNDAAWTNISTPTITSNTNIAPNGTLTADKIEDTSAAAYQGVQQTYSSISGVSYTGLIYVLKTTGAVSYYPLFQVAKNGLSSWSGLLIDTTAGTATVLVAAGYSSPTTYSVSSAGNYWAISMTVVASATSTTGFEFYPAASTNGSTLSASATGSAVIWGADLRPANQGVGLPAYQRVNTSTDYDTTGFPFYLAFDGSNDSLATGNINFSATDKMTAWTGVRKTKTAGNFGMIVELSSSILNNNSFDIAAPGAANSSTENYTFLTCGSANFTGYDAVTFTPPITSVLSCAYDNAGATKADQVKPRVNGVIPTLTPGGGGNTSSGNYSNSPLYIGARAGTSLFFASNLYGLIIRGAASTSDQITATENYMNTKTRAY